MNTVRVNAYSKLNLTLDITGAEGGYHTLDGVAVTVDLFDRVIVTKRKDALISVIMHGMGSESIPPEENNAQRAGEKFVARFGTNGANIKIFKNIPVGAGMGGSSADAAGVLIALAKLYAISDMGALKELADSLGSDTGYLLTGGFCRLSGRGEQVEKLGAAPDWNFLVVCPKSGVSAAECYREYDRLGMTYEPRTERFLTALKENPAWAARLFGNDLGNAAASLNGDVGRALDAVKALSPMGASVTGSGSAVFALFETSELCEWAKSRYKGKGRVYTVRCIDPVKTKRGRSLYALGEEEGK